MMFRLFLLFLIVACTAVDARLAAQGPIVKQQSDDDNACDNMADDLPDECTCSEAAHYHVVIECVKPFDSYYFNDTVGMKVDIDPCNSQGSSVDIDFVDIDRSIEYRITGVRAGEEENIPIPGMAILIPGIGNVGLDVAVMVEGNPDMLKLQVGLNACAAIHTHEICASSIPRLSNILPWWVLKGTYSFGEMCENANKELHHHSMALE